MGYQRMTQAEWADLIAQVGYQQAVDMAKNFGTIIDETNAPPTAVNPALAARVRQEAVPAPVAPLSARALQPSQMAAPYATVPPAAAQGQTNMNDTDQVDQTGGLGGGLPPRPDELTSLYSELQGMPAKRAELRKQQFEQGQKLIGQMYGGPSVSERLWALSQALLAPRRYKGFGATMLNLAQGLSGVNQQARTAEQQRKEALMRLQQSYDTGKFDDEMSALELRYKVAKERADAVAAARKASEPKYSPLTTGGFQQQPGTGGLPEMPQPDENGNYVITDPRQINFLTRGAPMVRAGDPAYKVGYAPGPTR